MPRVQNSITRKLTRMNMLVSGAALLIACAVFVAYDDYLSADHGAQPLDSSSNRRIE